MISQSFTAIVLAAGKGTRMRSRRPKVLHQIAGRSMIFHTLKMLKEAGAKRLMVVVGHGKEQLLAELSAIEEKLGIPIETVEQTEQRGTGHAARLAMESLSHLKSQELLLIMNGDSPLLSAQSIALLAAKQAKERAGLSLGCLHLGDPTGYGRVVCKGKWAQKIIEEKEANPREKKISLVNGGVYWGKKSFFQCLSKLKPSKATGEYYLTDIIALGAKNKVVPVVLEESQLRGANTLAELAQLERWYQQHQCQRWMESGVKILDPARVWIDADVELRPGAVIEPGVMLLGNTVLSEDVVIEQGARLKNVQVERGARIRAYSCLEESRVGEMAQIGPFAHLRPGTSIGPEAKVGNFVEFKKSQLGKGSKVSHLSYVGDATVGENVNIGCGFITCNYDGLQKHETQIRDGAFVGSDVQVIAPLTIGKDTYVASGSTLTKDVPDDALAIARIKQENKEGYAKRLRERLKRQKGLS